MCILSIHFATSYIYKWDRVCVSVCVCVFIFQKYLTRKSIKIPNQGYILESKSQSRICFLEKYWNFLG